MNGPFALQATQVEKRFGKVLALEALSLAVSDSEAMLLLGPNGSGKSTLLRLAMGFLHPTAGSIRTLGVDPMAAPGDLKNRIGFIADRLDAFASISVKALLSIAASLFRSWDDGVCENYMARFDLPLSQPVGALSRGMTTRLNLAIALSHRPELILFDEPTSGLDWNVRRDLYDCLAEQRQRGVAMLISGHDLHEIPEFFDSFALVVRGSLMSSGQLPMDRPAFVRSVSESYRRG